MADTNPEVAALGILARREIEAGVIAPLVRAFRERFGDEAVLPILAEVIEGLAREHGARLAQEAGGGTMRALGEIWEPWTRGGALELEWLEKSDRAVAFNVRRCRYAEMYRRLGIPELGRYLSCNRDAALVEGFSPDIELTRTQTIMEGAPFCDFRYHLRRKRPDEAKS
ncbi:MAG TPA: L-2-amino-thiazoline-4-carboxylic acid hydrolase [Thermodesulfobacteriota bacterium]